LLLLTSLLAVKADLPPLECTPQVNRLDGFTFCHFSLMNSAERDVTKVKVLESMFQGQKLLSEQITAVAIAASQFDNIPSAVFTNFGAVSRLRLNQLELKAIRKEDFKAAEHLMYLDMEKMQIREIESQAFQLAVNLVEVAIIKSKIAKFSVDAFSGLTKLKKIDLKDCGVATFSEAFFDNLPSSVKTLEMTESQLDEATLEFYKKFQSKLNA